LIVLPKGVRRFPYLEPIESLANDTEPLLRCGARITITRLHFLRLIAEMTRRIEVNLFFEQGLYMMLFASNGGGL
jgi:hypothetical protein